ncbi:hypothetical protein BC833DRAFT_586336 [Globomyces pollinis-pini]|nr:hypothetical protein BC833DRAFT_586336 [Globomyces pollinis-pini]
MTSVTLTFPFNDPQCWSSPNAVDLLQNHYFLTVKPLVQLPSIKSPGPGSFNPLLETPYCVPSSMYPGKYSFWFLNASESNLIAYDNCSNSGCYSDCVITGVQDFPLLNRQSMCSPAFFYENLTISESLRQTYYRNSDTKCDNSILYTIDIPLFTKCSKLSNNQYSVSSIEDNVLIQSLCIDSACSKCQTSRNVFPWDVNEKCHQLSKVSGANTVSMNVKSSIVSSFQTPSPTPSSLPEAVNNSSYSLLTIIVVLVILSITLAILVCAILYVRNYKTNKKHQLEKDKSATLLAPFIQAGMDQDAYSMYVDSIDENLKHMRSSTTIHSKMVDEYEK